MDDDEDGDVVLSCGCIDRAVFDPPCEEAGREHGWSHWHPNVLDALREDRFCRHCGAMETQRL